jgi:DNA-binding Lrp family transcriptional regulator
MVKNHEGQQTEDEMKILAELQQNSNQSVDVIAKRCGFSKQKAWRIIKKLEKSRTIWGYTAVVDEQKQGLQKFMISMKHSTKILGKETAEKVNLDGILKDYQELGIKIESSHYIHGEYDWVIIFTAKDLIQAKKFNELMVNKYPGVIEKSSLAQILHTPRNHYIINPNPLKVKQFV